MKVFPSVERLGQEFLPVNTSDASLNPHCKNKGKDRSACLIITCGREEHSHIEC